MNYAIRLALVSSLAVLAGCPNASETDAGRDVPGLDTPATDTPRLDTPAGSDVPGSDTPGTDVPGADAPGTDAPVADVPAADTGMCLPAGSDCSASSEDDCCAPTMCVPTGGAGLFRCIDETGCVPTGGRCGATDRCCAASACAGGMCLPTP